MLIIPNTNIVFIHIPKTGGQSLKAVFKMETDYPVHSINSPTDRRYIAGDYLRFCVVRDPIARFISVYKYNLSPTRSTNAVGNLGKFIVSEGADRDINKFCTVIKEKKDDFFRYAHIKPQIYFISRTRPQVILRLENIQRDIRVIFRMSGKKFKLLPVKNNSKDEMDSANIDLNESSVDFIRTFYRDDFRMLGYK